MGLLERFRDWLEDWGWWYGRLKPCDCPRSERYWGLATHPEGCEQVGRRNEYRTTETDAATVVEWEAVREWRCRHCGVEFDQHTGVVVHRETVWNGEEPTQEVDA